MKSKNCIFGIVVLFIVGVIVSLSYYLKQYYIAMELHFNRNQFPFYVVLFVLIVGIFIYTIANEINNRKTIKELESKVDELTTIMTSYHYSTLKAIDNTTEVVLNTHSMLKDKERT